MNHDPRGLEQIQRWMQAVITHPDGVSAGIDSDEARSEIDIKGEQVETVVNRSLQRTGIERLEVYANAYYARLLECLRDEFPALAHAVGEEVFDGFAFGYLQSHPPTSYTLGDLGRRFPEYLENTRPRDEEESEGPDWPDFLIDLARLERTYSEVFDGPGSERLTLLDSDRFQAISAEDWPRSRLIPVPCLRLLSLSYPVHEYATGVRKKADPAVPEPHPTWLAVTRIDYVVRRWPLSRIQYELLDALLVGQTVGHAIKIAAVTAAEIGENTDQLARNLRDWFEEWSAAGFFLGINRPASPESASN